MLPITTLKSQFRGILMRLREAHTGTEQRFYSSIHFDKKVCLSRCHDNKLHSTQSIEYSHELRPGLHIAVQSQAHGSKQWRGGSEAAGEAARLMAPPPPPPSHTFFASWSGTRVRS